MPSSIWEPLPPIRETDSVTALTAAGEVFFAGNAAGLFRRLESGAWERMNLTATEVQAMAASPDGTRLAVGAGTTVDVSSDGGKTWSRSELGTSGRVTALSMSGDRLLAGTDRSGVLLSTDGGRDWRPDGLTDQMVLAVCGDDLAGTEQGLWRRPGEARVGKTPEWHKLPLEGVVTALAQCGGRLLAGTEEHGLFRSDDQGQGWQACAGLASGINALAIEGSRVVAAASTGQCFLSEDGGDSWRELETLPSAAITVAIGGRQLLAGCYQTGCFELRDAKWKPVNEGIESTNAIDLLVGPKGPIVVASDGLRTFQEGRWEQAQLQALGSVRAACLDPAGNVILAAESGVFQGEKKLGELTDVTAVRSAPNGDLAVLTEDTLHLRLGEKWTQRPLSGKERVVGLAFSPSYPDDDALLLATLRQGTRASVLRYAPKSEQLDRIFDFDGRSRWLSFALPPNYRADVKRPAGFFVGTGTSLFRPAWPGQDWQRDIIHDETALVLSVAVAPTFEQERTVVVGTTAGVLITRNGGLLWTKLDQGLADPRCLKVLFGPDGRVYCLTPTRVYRLKED